GITVQGIAQRQRYFDVLPASEGHPFGWPLPVVRIGAPSAPRIACVLVLDDLTNGLRGSVAVEDRGKFQVASHVAIASDVTVLPPTDPRTGETVRYRLEPFAPLISASFARMAFPPQIAFKFPSGSLSVRVLRPDGTIDDLGSAPLPQAMNRSPLSRRGNAPAPARARRPRPRRSHGPRHGLLPADDARSSLRVRLRSVRAPSRPAGHADRGCERQRLSRGRDLRDLGGPASRHRNCGAPGDALR